MKLTVFDRDPVIHIDYPNSPNMNFRLFLALILFPSVLVMTVTTAVFQHSITLNTMSTLESKKIQSDIQKTLPQWRKYFEKYGKQYNVPWTLVAAVSYQESKWNNDATSYTGVKGLMQLTTVTAEHIGVDNREDPLQSIQGGAFYLRYLYEKSPTHLNSSDRWIQALAGYNIGWAHLRDIRKLAHAKHLDPYQWKNLKILLPMKANEKYRAQFNFGLARGQETVDFVESVLSYYHVLSINFPDKSRQRTIANADSAALLSQLQFTPL